MTDTSIRLQPAYVMQQRNYRETSLLLEVLTQDYGMVPILAQGVRKSKSKTAAVLRPFQALLISYNQGKGELCVLTQVEMQDPMLALKGVSLYCAYYLNELILRFVARFDPCPEIFDDYRVALQALCVNTNLDADDQHLERALIERNLRQFELTLLEHAGLGLSPAWDVELQVPVQANKHYMLIPDKGGAVEHPQGNVSGEALLALANGVFENINVLQEAKQIMRSVIDFHLQGRPLKSRAVIAKIFQQL